MFSRSNAKYICLFSAIAIAYGLFFAIFIMKADQWRLNKSQEYLSKAKIETDVNNQILLYEQAAFLNPSEETYLAAGIAALKLGDNNLARSYLTRVKTAQGYSQLATAYYNLEKYELAISNYQKAIAETKSADFYSGMGKAYLKIGDLENSKTALEASYAIQQTNETADLLLLLGSDIDITSVSPSAAVLRVGMLEKDPANKAILAYNSLENLGYPQAAIAILYKAATEGALNRNSLFALAIEQKNENNYQTSYDYLVQAKAIDPYYPQIYQQLVIICEKLGKTDEAKKYSDYLAAITF